MSRDAMAAKSDIWMPIYIGDYVADTMHLTTEQHGAYLLLLFHMWRSGGYIDDDDTTLAAVARLPLEAWRNNRRVIVGLLKSETKRLFSPRLLAELEKASKRADAAFRNGIKGGRPKNNPDETRRLRSGKPKHNPPGNPNETSSQSQSAVNHKNDLHCESASRPRDEMWDAVVAVFGFTTVADSQRGMLNRVVKDLKTMNASPGDIVARLANFNSHWPDITPTPTALVKHWHTCARPRPSGDKSPEDAMERIRAINKQAENLPFSKGATS